MDNERRRLPVATAPSSKPPQGEYCGSFSHICSDPSARYGLTMRFSHAPTHFVPAGTRTYAKTIDPAGAPLPLASRPVDSYSKRRRFNDFTQYGSPVLLESTGLDDTVLANSPVVIWPDDLLFEVDASQISCASRIGQTAYASKNTPTCSASGSATSASPSNFWDLPPEIRGAVATKAAVPYRHVDLAMPNPFLERSQNRHLRVRAKNLPRDGDVNGYIKLRIRPDPSSHLGPIARKRSAERGPPHVGLMTYLNQIPYLPPDFGRGFNLDEIDDRIFKFCKFNLNTSYSYSSTTHNPSTAFNDLKLLRTTLLPQHNYWLHEVAPMMTQNQCVKHAVLAFAAGYVLDFVTTDGMRKRANEHYKTAIFFLDRALASSASHDIGKGDDVVAALLLLVAEDLVNHELSMKQDCSPRWWNGARVAKRILDNTDPGYRYWNPPNVQTSKARLANANRVAFINILTEPLTPLSWTENKELYGWLLQGSAAEIRCIHNGTGLCPKLLHMMAQVTFLSARLQRHPDSIVYAQVALHLLSRLDRLRQHSELSPGYPSSSALFEASTLSLSPDGKVSSPAILVDLIGQSWISSTELYARCRLFRRPRSHPGVLKCMATLTTCIELMPFSGELFTSQAPFFPIFVLGLLSEPGSRARAVSTEWFETVMATAGSRSSVPPVWEALQGMWMWMDTEGIGRHEDLNHACLRYESEASVDDSAVVDRAPWWEDMISRLVADYGVLSLY
ncbi:hypothetical protein FH972_021026 [Carpinus fangiana]|uniref:Transcription factor domain-containing protein n=1 Tax=Carpinus fangiana TaxID=176857 RepID=A0A5N6KQ92_9ROSI|nr:hypothetical protein FH972_021026 [Carpinus fangiana]